MRMGPTRVADRSPPFALYGWCQIQGHDQVVVMNWLTKLRARLRAARQGRRNELSSHGPMPPDPVRFASQVRRLRRPRGDY